MSSTTSPVASCLRRILCPTDFSPFSLRALAYAVALARPARARIVLLHVCVLPLPDSGADYVPEWVTEEPGMRAQLLEKLRTFGRPALEAGLRVDLLLEEGNPADEILRAAASVNADLIVLGSHGRRGVEMWILGSHAERVVRSSTCPVLIVSGDTASRGEPAGLRLRHVLCADGASEHSAATVEYARRLAENVGAGLTLVHVREAGRSPRTPKAEAFEPGESGGSSVERRTARGVPSTEILRAARDSSADLIVIGSHDRDAGSCGFLGSTCDRVIRQAECGVLVLKGIGAGSRHARESTLASIA